MIDRDYLKNLLKLLEDANHQREAVERLAALGEDAIPYLVRALGDENEQRFAGAAQTLLMMDVASVVSVIIDSLVEENELQRDGILMLLRHMGAPAIQLLIDALMTDQEWLIDSVAGALCDIGDPSLYALIDALQDPSETRRVGAAVVLGRMRDERAVEALIVTLHDSNVWVRRCAAMSLGKIGAVTIEPLMAALKDEDVGVRVSAAYALSQIGEPALFPLLDALHNPNVTIRVYAVHALGDLGDARAIQPLQEAVNNDPDQKVRRSAEKALLKLQS
jgi:HEAT repeat protein